MERLYIERLQRMWAQQPTPWVLFAHGTCVLLTWPVPDLARAATDLVEHWPEYVGGKPSDDMALKAHDVPGWLITCAHPDVFSYVAPEEVESEEVAEADIVRRAHAKREQDAHEQRIILVKAST